MTLGPDLKTVSSPGGPSRKRPAADYLRSTAQLKNDALRKQLETIIPYAQNHGTQLIRVCDATAPVAEAAE